MMDVVARKRVEMAAALDAVVKARDVLHRLGMESASDVIRGLVVGYAMAYREIDPPGAAHLLRGLSSPVPTEPGHGLRLVVNNP